MRSTLFLLTLFALPRLQASCVTAALAVGSQNILETFLARHNSKQNIAGVTIVLDDQSPNALARGLFFESTYMPPRLPIPYEIVGARHTVKARPLESGPLESSSDTYAYKDLVRSLIGNLPYEPTRLHDLGAGNSMATLGGYIAQYGRLHHKAQILFANRQYERLSGKDIPVEEWEKLHQAESASVKPSADYWKARALELGMYFKPDLKIIAVDASQQALTVSRENVKFYSLEDDFDFVNADMLDYLSQQDFTRSDAVVSNPPYVPVPALLKDPTFAAVDGGEDGAKYLKAILSKKMPSGVRVGLLWSSLSSPKDLIENIERDYVVEESFAYKIKFGKYTSDPRVLAHLIKMRAEGKIFFSDNPDGSHSYTLVGTVLRRK